MRPISFFKRYLCLIFNYYSLSSHRFPYDYLVMTSFQLPTSISKNRIVYNIYILSINISKRCRLPERDRQCVQNPEIIHRDVLTSITSHSSLIFSSCREQSELRWFFMFYSNSHYCLHFVPTIVANLKPSTSTP